MALPNIDLSDMSAGEMIAALEAIVFTSARGYQRGVRIDARSRDILVRALTAITPEAAKT